MSDGKALQSLPPPPGASAALVTTSCARCGCAVDPLRAARVAIFSERFFYFCSAACREGFTPESAPPPPSPRQRPAASVDASEHPRVSPTIAPPAPFPSSVRGLPAAALLLGVAAFALAFSPGGARLWASIICSGFACIGLTLHAAHRGAENGPRTWLLEALAPIASVGAAAGSLWAQSTDAGLTTAAAASICVAAATGASRLGDRRGLGAARDRVERALAIETRGGAPHRSPNLKAGEELLLETDDVAPVDLVIRAGQASVQPWDDAPFALMRHPGESIITGARLRSGAIRGLIRWAGNDRAWARLTRDPERRADRHAAHAKLARQLSGAGAAAAGLIAAVIAISSDARPLSVLSYAAAGLAALASVGLRDRVAGRIAEGLHAILFQGVVLRSAAALDRAGRVSFAVFCAQGTLLRGEYSVASIEPAKGMDTEELLRLCAGAYAGIPSAIGAALSQSARAHELRPDATRSHNHRPGLGVTAVASSGRPLVVGTRALLLECHVSAALAEERIAELETAGRQVLLVALDGRWVGLIALSDTLESSARGAVQRLLDAGVEPVLLSGDARDTCRALARHLGIDDVRPEILPEERAREIERLSRAGATVAVIGRSSRDDSALGAAALSINIDPGGAPLERWDMEVVSGDVRDAAAAIALARDTYSDTRRALVMGAAPVFSALLLVALGAPPWLAPLSSLAGSLLPWKGEAPLTPPQGRGPALAP